MALRCRSLLGPRVKRPRLWGTVLILGAIPPLLLGKGLSSCFISANGQCFEAFDQTAGTLLLMVGGLLLLAGLMVLSTAWAARSRRRGRAERAPIRNPRGRTLGPWGRWALALFVVAAISTAAAFVVPWWEVRGTDGTSSTLYYGTWCDTISRGPYAGPSRCFPYTGPPGGIPVPDDFVFTMLQLRVVVATGAVFLVVGTGGLAVPRIRERAPRLVSGALVVGTALVAVSVADAFFIIPGGLATFLLDPAYGFSAGNSRGNENYVWGPSAAWFLLFLAAATGGLGLIAIRAAFRSSARTIRQAVRSGGSDGSD